MNSQVKKVCHTPPSSLWLYLVFSYFVNLELQVSSY